MGTGAYGRTVFDIRTKEIDPASAVKLTRHVPVEKVVGRHELRRCQRLVQAPALQILKTADGFLGFRASRELFLRKQLFLVIDEPSHAEIVPGHKDAHLLDFGPWLGSHLGDTTTRTATSRHNPH